jgi:hypothetical protein
MDGHMDLVRRNSTTGKVEWLENGGDGDFQGVSQHVISSSDSQTLAIGDIDDDGDVDVLISQNTALVTVPNTGDALDCNNPVIDTVYGETAGNLFLRCSTLTGGAGTGLSPSTSISCLRFDATQSTPTADLPSAITTPVSVTEGSYSSALTDGSTVKEYRQGTALEIKDSSNVVKKYSLPCV